MTNQASAVFAAIVVIGAIATAVLPTAILAQETRLMSVSPATMTADAEGDIRTLIANQAEAWNRHDAKGWAAPFVQSAEFINILGTPFSGKPAIEGITTRIFATIFKGSHDSVSVQKIVWVSPELAIVHYEHAVSGYSALPPGIQPSEMGADGKGVLRTLMVYVLKKSADGWQIVNGQNTAILPEFKAP